MTDLLKAGSDWLQAQRKAGLATQVDYEHDGQVCQVAATKGKSNYEGVNADGSQLGDTTVDFLVTAADLPFAPEPSDLVREMDGTEYRVVAAGGDVNGWRWSDDYRRTYRIHTRQVTDDE